MKYDIGDIVKIRKMRFNDYVVFQDKVGIILEKFEYQGDEDYRPIVPAYRVLVAGIEGTKHFIYEEEIEGKLG